MKRNILVSLTCFAIVFPIFPMECDQAEHVNVAQATIANIGIEEPATLVYLMRTKDRYPPRRG